MRILSLPARCFEQVIGGFHGKRDSSGVWVGNTEKQRIQRRSSTQKQAQRFRNLGKARCPQAVADKRLNGIHIGMAANTRRCRLTE
ncbi:MAG: hypothetical protein RKP20_16115 [Candidatus Competibacter sp.]|nr:hypothetical protein [Candidatus Competibacter sp.]